MRRSGLVSRRTRTIWLAPSDPDEDRHYDSVMAVRWTFLDSRFGLGDQAECAAAMRTGNERLYDSRGSKPTEVSYVPVWPPLTLPPQLAMSPTGR